MAEGDEFTRRFAKLFAELTVGCVHRGFVGFDAATDYFQGRPVNSVFPLAHEPDIAVLLHGEHAGAVFDLDELVDRFGAEWQDDAIFAQADQIALMNQAAG